ncbi:MAG: hypothetical protein JSV88_03300 [Candidatus Aminicenantes bacterium]|nr:MAG: hypothetical protein JSV88_03300 [Candidatus Aminicenantes bacterium]
MKKFCLKLCLAPKIDLETLINYLMSSAGNLEEKEIEAPVSEVFNEGGEIMATIADIFYFACPFLSFFPDVVVEKIK